MLSPDRKYIQFVIKASKHCNLRCRYCYEFASLGDTTRISLDNCSELYRNVARFLEKSGGKEYEVHFIWHGGEPLLIPVSFYDATFEQQDRTFKSLNDKIKIKNLIQTNLTFLDWDRIELLRKFDHVGVSTDIIGGLRRDIKGRSREIATVRNMERLKLEGIDFGTITVLSKENLNNILQVYLFMREFNIPLRFLDLHEGSPSSPITGFDVTTEEIISAYKILYNEWISEERFYYAEPMFSYTAASISYLFDYFPKRYYRKDTWVNTILVDTDGECYGYNDDYGNKRVSYGNIFTGDLCEFFDSDSYLASVRKAERQLACNCIPCPYFGSCSGHPIAEGKNNEREKICDDVFKCVVERRMFDYIVEDLRSRLNSGNLATLANFTAAKVFASQGMKQGQADIH